jgi:hypothetical protein
MLLTVSIIITFDFRYHPAPTSLLPSQCYSYGDYQTITA